MYSIVNQLQNYFPSHWESDLNQNNNEATKNKAAILPFFLQQSIWSCTTCNSFGYSIHLIHPAFLWFFTSQVCKGIFTKKCSCLLAKVILIFDFSSFFPCPWNTGDHYISYCATWMSNLISTIRCSIPYPTIRCSIPHPTWIPSNPSHL